MNATLEDLIQPQDRIILRIERLSDDGLIIHSSTSTLSGLSLRTFNNNLHRILELELHKAYQQLPKESC